MDSSFISNKTGTRKRSRPFDLIGRRGVNLEKKNEVVKDFGAMLRIELVYDPTSNPPLKLNLPLGTNPNLIICLFAQVITGNASGLILPPHTLGMVSKT